MRELWSATVANQKRKNRKSKKGAGQRWRVCGEVDEEKQAASSTKKVKHSRISR